MKNALALLKQPGLSFLALGILGGLLLSAAGLVSTKGSTILWMYILITGSILFVLARTRITAYSIRFFWSLFSFVLSSIILYGSILLLDDVVSLPLMEHTWRIGFIFLVGSVLCAILAWISPRLPNFMRKNSITTVSSLVICLINVVLLSSCDTHSTQFNKTTGVDTILSEESLMHLKPGCDAAAAWIQENNALIPKTYETMTKLPLSYRRALFAISTPRERSLMWKTHLQNLMNHSYLNDAQIAILGDIVMSVNDNMFRNNGHTYERYTSRQLKSIFGKEKAALLFIRLGDGFNEAVSGKVPISQRKPSLAIPNNDCGCNQGDDWCDAWNLGLDPVATTCQTGDGCGSSSWGCGTFWTKSCNGECVDDL